MPYILSTISETLNNTSPRTQSWDYVNQCMNILMHSDGVNLSVGEEEYYPLVTNATGTGITNGMLVGFGAVDGGLDVVPYLADGSFPPWHIAGVATQDIASGARGRVTKFGYLRNIDTTGSFVGETWLAGDILYASPIYPGMLTNTKPTAPSVVIPVAMVRTVDATEGVLLVRVTPQPRLYYGVFSANFQQDATLANTVYALRYNASPDIASGFSIASDGVNDTRIIAANSGLYNFQFSVELNSSSSSSRDVFIWPRIGTVGGSEADVPNACSQWTIKSNTEAFVPSWNFVLSLNAGQYFRLMWSASGTGVFLPYVAAITTPYVRPAIPSIILTVTQVNQ